MLEKIETKKLPYVDGVPDVDQKRIPWIKNGDELDGASTKTGNDGFLNGASLAVQKNVETLSVNVDNGAAKINELVDSVNKISDDLNSGTDGDIISQVGKNTSDIVSLRLDVTSNMDNINVASDDISKIKNDIGAVQENSSVTRSVRDDVTWVKKELGQYDGQDTDGTMVIGNEATGIKRRVIDNSTLLASHNSKILELSDKFENADVDGLSNNLNAIRKEIGDSAHATDNNIYARLNLVESRTSADMTAIDSIKVLIDYDNADSISNRTVALENESAEIIHKIDGDGGLVSKITDINTKLGSSSEPLSVIGKVETNSANVSNIWTVLGHDTSSGVQKHLSWVDTQIGISSDGETPKAGSILDRLNSISSQNNQMSGSIQDIQAEIGNNTEGLKGRINTLNSKMDGEDDQGTTIEALGVYNYAKKLGSSVDAKLSDAPSDGKTYLRKNNEWVHVPNAIAQLSKETVSIDFSEGNETLISFNQLTPEDWNNNVTVDNQYIIVNDSGVFKLQLYNEVESQFAHLKLAIKVNDVDKAVSTSSATDTGGEYQMVSADNLVKLEVGDKLSIAATPLTGESQILINLNNVKFTLIPII